MKKVSILMISGLMIIICAVVFWQWHVYSKDSDKPAEPKEELSIIASVKVEANQLRVKQTFQGLDANRKYEALIPAQVSEIKCTDAKRKAL